MQFFDEFFASCPKNIEPLLETELVALGAEATKKTLGGVYFKGPLSLCYRALLCSRLANRVMVILGKARVENLGDMQAFIRNIPWSEHFSVNASIFVSFSGKSDFINNTLFGAQAVKDAICDRFLADHNKRPDVALQNPDIRISAHLFSNQLTMGIDLTGRSLHERYRKDQGEAPIKENLAAALLMRANWPLQYEDNMTFVDPFCGSGTVCIEAALLAKNKAPGLLRDSFGFESWLGHQPQLYVQAREYAQAQEHPIQCKIIGYDHDETVIFKARENAKRAGVADMVQFKTQALHALHFEKVPGLILTNPPYGERLSQEKTAMALMQHLGEVVQKEAAGTRLGIITNDPQALKILPFTAPKKYAFFNGDIPCELLIFQTDVAHQFIKREKTTPVETVLSTGSQMFVNRLEKNFKKLKSWLTKENVEAYRLYDADMPEYAVVVDVYGKDVHVQEYAPPKSIDPIKAQARLDEVLQGVTAFFKISSEHVFLKQRKRQVGKTQYQKQDLVKNERVVQEQNIKFLVNLSDYLDTGLFLDHRPMRRYMLDHAKDKRVLNLFCYTGSISVAAAKAGAKKIVSVDMSHTYLAWARANFALNGLSDLRHEFVEVDCVKWLAETRGEFDLIFCDPPTFSNSKKTDTVLDTQRDHAHLIVYCMRLLSKTGVLLFSTNASRFVLNETLSSQYKVEDISAKTFDPDFPEKKAHRVYRITHSA